MIEVLLVAHLNNILEQDHPFIKQIADPMEGTKSVTSAAAALAGAETAYRAGSNLLIATFSFVA